MHFISWVSAVLRHAIAMPIKLLNILRYGQLNCDGPQGI